MPFTVEQDAFILMAHFRSGTRNPDGTWSYSLQSCIEQFEQEWPEEHVPYELFKHRRTVITQRFQDKHCICKGKSTGRTTLLTENVVNDIRTRMDDSPNKSITKLSAQTGKYSILRQQTIIYQQFCRIISWYLP